MNRVVRAPSSMPPSFSLMVCPLPGDCFDADQHCNAKALPDQHFQSQLSLVQLTKVVFESQCYRCENTNRS